MKLKEVSEPVHPQWVLSLTGDSETYQLLSTASEVKMLPRIPGAACKVSDAALALDEAAERKHRLPTGAPQMLAQVWGDMRERALDSLNPFLPFARLHIANKLLSQALHTILEFPHVPRPSILNIAGKMVLLIETYHTFVLILTDSQGTLSKVALKMLHRPAFIP